MKDGFVKVASVTAPIEVADVEKNVEALRLAILEAAEAGAKVIVGPELGITGYTAEDLFWQTKLLAAAEEGVKKLAEDIREIDALVLVGLPFAYNGNLYNCAAALHQGQVIALIPKQHIPNYNEFYEARHFVSGPKEVSIVASFAGSKEVPFGANQVLNCKTVFGLAIAVEICEDLWVANPPSISHAEAGATLICNLSASNELVGKADYRRDLVRGQSARLICAYVYASSGFGESTQDVVYSGHHIIAENGQILGEAQPFSGACAISEIDIDALLAERRRMSTFVCAPSFAARGYHVTDFSLQLEKTELTRFIDPQPFVPKDVQKRTQRCEEVFNIQSYGLAKRLSHTHSKTAVIGVSGGLDSTLALLVVARAFDVLGLDRQGIIAVTMPGFGTTERTHGNATVLSDALGATLREVSISEAVRAHFRDIGHDEALRDVTYENAQARERTQILMDIANQEGGLVIGTGDLSELALGWATYNADHMSMYGVNASVPKTLVRHLVRYVADSTLADDLRDVLYDVLDTPVSPELLPAESDGTIAQKTEDLVGPYELHDFFLYQILRKNFSPKKVYRLAVLAFANKYSDETIVKWLKTFYRRFFSQQFKRSCLPDGPKVGTVAVSPRGDLRMPSDAVSRLWLRELEYL